MLTEAKAIAARARDAGNLPEALKILRELPLDDFGALMLDPAQHGLGDVLPEMPMKEVQVHWTGNHGAALLSISLAFMRTVESLNARFRRRSLFDQVILDYGCGWGRLLRLALYYSNPEKLIGVDAWESSLKHCRDAGVQATFHRIAAAPDTLPDMPPIDVAYAYSVFTHLPERVARSALRAIRTVIAPEGLFVFTFRPIEFWQGASADQVRSTMENEHRTRGLAFQAAPKSSDYGDTSMSHEFVARMLNECGWRKLAFEKNLGAPLQDIVVAAPA